MPPPPPRARAPPAHAAGWGGPSGGPRPASGRPKRSAASAGGGGGAVWPAGGRVGRPDARRRREGGAAARSRAISNSGAPLRRRSRRRKRAGRVACSPTRRRAVRASAARSAAWRSCATCGWRGGWGRHQPGPPGGATGNKSKRDKADGWGVSMATMGSAVDFYVPGRRPPSVRFVRYRADHPPPPLCGHCFSASWPPGRPPRTAPPRPNGRE